MQFSVLCARWERVRRSGGRSRTWRCNLAVPSGSKQELRSASGEDPVPGVALVAPPFYRVWRPGVNLVRESIVEVELDVNSKPGVEDGLDRILKCTWTVRR